ncbi:cytochrome P450 [Kibdelosporangium persicum]|uniref:Epi-isozizaene 5-monooxygenase/(E)-beta-farnesene synthase n=2 Tax=Kibdelosporangium persicum TaxID=2698649 RepID=A0ABX2FIK7_9PSEU|nr:Epi-isozizaene 5-monooxygenase/(E)-beta-farnesene synthase [Kibdelosporangium persicum]
MMVATGLPPGPALPAMAQTILSVTNPLSFADRCRAKYGDVFTMRVFPVGQVVCVSDIGIIRDIVTSDGSVFRAGEANSVIEFVVGRNSLLMLDGGEHIRRRRVLLPPFRGASVRGHQRSVGQIAADCARWWPVGRPIRLLPRMQEITLEIMMRSVFGITDLARLAGLRTLVPQLLHMNPAIMLFPPLRRDLGPRSPGGRYARVKRAVDGIIHQEIDRRRRDTAGTTGEDVLSGLMDVRDEHGAPLSDEELRDHLVTLLAVGHETTATSMSWIFERLVRHPRVLARLRTEIAESTTDEPEYVDAVINETLRLRPVVSDIARVATTDTRVGGYHVPRGTMIALSISAIHRSPDQFSAPEAFRPERFLDGETAHEVFLPFGGGPHRCLGASFAMMVMRRVVPRIVAELDIRAARPEPESARLTGPVLTPSRGAEVVVSRR